MKTRVKNFEGMGRGLVATKKLRKGEIVELSEVILLDQEECTHLAKTLLNLYVFEWKKGNLTALALGNGSLFNHGGRDGSNITYSTDYDRNKMVFRATRTVKKGEQLLINYGYDPVYQFEKYKTLKANEAENRK